MKPIVSVRIMAYQSAPYIRKCIDSVLTQQTDFPFEICIGEDGSTDGTREICLEYQSMHPDIVRVFLWDRSLPEHRAMPPARYNFINTIKKCQGKYIALLDGDDYWTDPHKLQKQVDFLESHPDFSICFTNTSYEDNETGKLTKVKTAVKDVLEIGDLFHKNYIATQTVMYRAKEMYLPVDFAQLYVGDWSLHVMMAQFGKIKHIDEYTAVYRVHQSNLWQKKDSLQKQKRMAEATEFLFKNLQENYKPLAMTKLKSSYYFLSSSFFKSGDKEMALYFYRKLSALPGSWLTKNMYLLFLKKFINT